MTTQKKVHRTFFICMAAKNSPTNRTVIFSVPFGGCLLSLCQFLDFFHPDCHAGVTGHTPVTSGRYGHAADFRSVRQAGSLKLLHKKSSIKGLQPFQNYIFVIHSVKRSKGQAIDLCRRKTETQHLVQEKVMQLIRPHQILRFLGDHTVLWRQKLRTHRCIQYIQKDGT